MSQDNVIGGVNRGALRGWGMLVTLVGIGVVLAALAFIMTIAAKVSKDLDPGKSVWAADAKALKD